MLDTGHTSKHKLLLTINTHCRVSFVPLFVLDPHAQPSISIIKISAGEIRHLFIFICKAKLR